MQIYRPKSFFFFLLGGFLIVCLPLIGAIVNAELYLSSLTRQSADIVYRSVTGTEKTKKLEEMLFSLERKARQYQALGSDNLWSEYASLHHTIKQHAREILQSTLPADFHAQIQSLVALEDQIFNTLGKFPPNSEQATQIIDHFKELGEMATSVHTRSNVLIFDKLGKMQNDVNHAREVLVIEASILVFLTIVLVTVFSYYLTKPIKNIDRAIHQLGKGDFRRQLRLVALRILFSLGSGLTGYVMNWLLLRKKKVNLPPMFLTS